MIVPSFGSAGSLETPSVRRVYGFYLMSEISTHHGGEQRMGEVALKIADSVPTRLMNITYR